MKRREFLKYGIKAGVAVNMLPIALNGIPVRALGRSPFRQALDSRSSSPNILVIIQLAGGNDGLNCVVPYTDRIYSENRPRIALKRDADNLFVLPEHDTLALHTNMKGIFDLYKEHKVSILQNVGYKDFSLSHFRGTDIWNHASDSDNNRVSTGWVGRMLSEFYPNYPLQKIEGGSHPPALQFGESFSNIFLSKNGGMGIAVDRLPTSGNANLHNYDASPEDPLPYDIELENVRVIQSETEIYTETITNRSVKQNKIAYPANNILAEQLANTAQLIASGFTTKVYLVTQAGYDTHGNQLRDQGRLLGELAEAVLAFQRDLEASGVADRVMTMTYSEFGRRVKENFYGTDHGTAAPMFLFGTQVKAGIKGHDPDLHNLIDGNLAFDPEYEFRNVYATLMGSWFGCEDKIISSVLHANDEEVFSETEKWNKLALFK